MRLLSGSDEIPVLSATITWSLRGPWVADLILDAEAAPSGSVVLEQGTVRLRGTVAPGASAFAGRAGVRVIAGGGALQTDLPVPRQYRDAPLSLVLGDLGADSGELIKAATDAEGALVLRAPTGGG